MTQENISGSDGSRRDFLRLGWTLAAGVAVPPALLQACGGSGGNAALMETFVEPQVLASSQGRLEVTLNLSYLTTRLYGKTVSLRNMYGTIPAPTFRLNAGDTLRVLLVNSFPPNPPDLPSSEPVKHLRYPNSTNLHVHGLHVNPGMVSTVPEVFGDFVVDDPDKGVHPGQVRQHEFKIGADHPPGAYWYHPHLHGSTAMQVGSGMAGMLQIKGAVDRVPEIAAARERMFVFQAPIHNEAGLLESFVQVADNGGAAASNTGIPTGEPAYLINGVRVPRLVMRTGEVQNWHFLNAAIFKYLNLCLDGHTLNVYSLDGNTRATLLPVGPIVPDPKVKQTGVVLAPGNRASVLVKAGAPGTYQLRTLTVGVTQFSNLLPDVLAEVVVLDEAMPMNLPAGPLPLTKALAPITDAELAAAGGLKRTVVFRAVTNPTNNGLPKRPVTEAPANQVVKPGDELADWVFNAKNSLGEPNTLSNTVLGVGSPTASGPPDSLTEIIPFQSSRAKKQTVALGSVEEWTIYNMNNVFHPFHIHVNPCYVVRSSDKPDMAPYWADTIALPAGTPEKPGSITFRSRFLDFRGAYVLHCHMLAHEDMGMMQVVEVV